MLVEINQRNEWWINYPVYQSHLKGAAALIAVQTGGYGEVDDAALNAQDIAGPPEAAAFSISRKDAGVLKELLADSATVAVTLDACTRVERDRTTYNIIGELTGRNPDRKIMLSAHYDSYFDGFQDDNTAISMMLGMGKALVETGWQPENTILFLRHGVGGMGRGGFPVRLVHRRLRAGVHRTSRMAGASHCRPEL